MKQAEFDRFADEYDEQHREVVAITGEAPEYFAEYKIRVLADLAAKAAIVAQRVLDFGAGIGNSVPYMRRYFPGADLVCADVSQRSLDLAGRRFGRTSRFVLIESDRIPVEDGAFDVAFSACVFHHINHVEHVRWLEELHRVTRPGGMVAVFEHNPLNPLTVRAVRDCPFDENARLLRSGQLAASFKEAGWSNPQVRFHVFFPASLRALRFLEPSLTALPLGAQYSVTVRKQV